jgi:hypothetical protein
MVRFRNGAPAPLSNDPDERRGSSSGDTRQHPLLPVSRSGESVTDTRLVRPVFLSVEVRVRSGARLGGRFDSSRPHGVVV